MSDISVHDFDMYTLNMQYAIRHNYDWKIDFEDWLAEVRNSLSSMSASDNVLFILPNKNGQIDKYMAFDKKMLNEVTKINNSILSRILNVYPRFIATLFIKFYQKYISPKKGYKCAHNICYNNGGCSKRVLNHVSQLPVSKWYKAYKVETKLCDIAYKNIQEKSRNKITKTQIRRVL
jgi:hypothetical protein